MLAVSRDESFKTSGRFMCDEQLEFEAAELLSWLGDYDKDIYLDALADADGATAREAMRGC